jgi:hypothetical protein
VLTSEGVSLSVLTSGGPKGRNVLTSGGVSRSVLNGDYLAYFGDFAADEGFNGVDEV